jgi:hypothetical protein
MNAGIMALIWKKIYNIPYVITEHYGIYNHILPDNYSTRSFFYKQWLKAIFKNYLQDNPFSCFDINKSLSFQTIPAARINKTVSPKSEKHEKDK